MTLIWVKMRPSPCVSAISLNLIKKATIPFYTPNSISTKTANLPSISSGISKKKILNKSTNSLPYKSNLISLLAANLLLVHDQTIPQEIPGENPPEFPSNPDINYPSSVPPEVPEFSKVPEIETAPRQPPDTPEIPTPGPPEYPFPPLPTPPDIPIPPQPPDRLPPDPDILPPPPHPPPDIQPPPDLPPEIKHRLDLMCLLRSRIARRWT